MCEARVVESRRQSVSTAPVAAVSRTSGRAVLFGRLDGRFLLREKLSKLDMNGGGFSESLVHFERQLVRFITALDPSNLDDHVALARTAPWSMGDAEHFEEPSLVSILAYRQE